MPAIYYWLSSIWAGSNWESTAISCCCRLFSFSFSFCLRFSKPLRNCEPSSAQQNLSLSIQSLRHSWSMKWPQGSRLRKSILVDAHFWQRRSEGEKSILRRGSMWSLMYLETQGQAAATKSISLAGSSSIFRSFFSIQSLKLSFRLLQMQLLSLSSLGRRSSPPRQRPSASCRMKGCFTCLPPTQQGSQSQQEVQSRHLCGAVGIPLRPHPEQSQTTLIFSLSFRAYSLSSRSSSPRKEGGNLARHMGQLTEASSCVLCLAHTFRHSRWKLLPHPTRQQLRHMSWRISSWQTGHTASSPSVILSTFVTCSSPPHLCSAFRCRNQLGSSGKGSTRISWNCGLGRRCCACVCLPASRSSSQLSTQAACQMMGLSTATRKILRRTQMVWMQWSLRCGEQEQRRSGPICVRYLLSRRSLKVKDSGPPCPTRKRVILEATSSSCITCTGSRDRYGCERDISALLLQEGSKFHRTAARTGKAQRTSKPGKCDRMRLVKNAPYNINNWTWPWVNMPELRTQKLGLSSKLLIIGGVLGVAGIIATYLYRRSQNTSSLPANHPPHQIEHEDAPEKAFARVIHRLKKEISGGSTLNSQTIKVIYRSQFQLSESQFKKLTLKSREERRRVMDDMRQYREAVAAYEEEVVDLHNKHLNAVLAHFKINKADWIDAVNELSTSGEEDWDAFLLETEAEQLETLRRKDRSRIAFEVLAAIHKFKIVKIRENMAALRQIGDIERSDLYSLAQKWIQDAVFTIFRAEPEDVNYSIEQLSSNQKKVIGEYEDQYCDLVQSLVFDDSELLAEN